MNEATEWLQYARSLKQPLADFIHESDTVDCQRVAHGTLAVDTADEGKLFERDVPKGHVTVSIWVDDLREPRRVFINVERALGAV